MQRAAVNDKIPAESDIEMAVRVLKGGRAGRPPGMIEEDLKGWHKEAKREKYSKGISWELVVRLIQVVFRDGTVPEEIVWAMMVLLLKGKEE